MSIDVNGTGYKEAWRVGLRDEASTEDFAYVERRKFWLNRARIAEIRAAVFPKKAHAALSAKLDDYDLMVS